MGWTYQLTLKISKKKHKDYDVNAAWYVRFAPMSSGKRKQKKE